MKKIKSKDKTGNPALQPKNIKSEMFIHKEGCARELFYSDRQLVCSFNCLTLVLDNRFAKNYVNYSWEPIEFLMLNIKMPISWILWAIGMLPFISNNRTNLESIEDYGGFKTQTRLIKVKQ